jgi:uncharacterized protein
MAKVPLSCWRGEEQVLTQVTHANHFFSRLCGLLGRENLKPEQALLITPCNSVHTLGMRFAIGVIFLDRESRVLHLIPDMQPGQFSPMIKGSKQVLELHPETLATWHLQVGELLRFA